MSLFQSPFEPNNWILRFLRYLRYGYFMDLHAWLAKSEKVFGRLTFLESYQKTGRILNISVTRAGNVGESIVLNHQNAPHVLIFSAVVASGAFPFLGLPIHLMEKAPSGEIVTSMEYSGRYFQGNVLNSRMIVSSRHGEVVKPQFDGILHREKRRTGGIPSLYVIYFPNRIN